MAVSRQIRFSCKDPSASASTQEWLLTGLWLQIPSNTLLFGPSVSRRTLDNLNHLKSPHWVLLIPILRRDGRTTHVYEKELA